MTTSDQIKRIARYLARSCDGAEMSDVVELVAAIDHGITSDELDDETRELVRNRVERNLPDNVDV